MTLLEEVLQNQSERPIAILANEVSAHKYIPIDLSVFNRELETLDIGNPKVCQDYIEQVLNNDSFSVAYGGYLETRNLYRKSPNFGLRGDEVRNIHLGMDFWFKAGTKVITPIEGHVHSFKNNAISGDYGPTIILRHELDGTSFYTLYGHLSIESLEGLYIDKKFEEGEVLASLGDTPINVNYAPHLHFQIIEDLGDYYGDYPGVCSKSDLPAYQKNCPDPNLLLKITPAYIG